MHGKLNLNVNVSPLKMCKFFSWSMFSKTVHLLMLVVMTFQESFREGLLQSAEELKRHVMQACDDFQHKGPFSNTVPTKEVRYHEYVFLYILMTTCTPEVHVKNFIIRLLQVYLICLNIIELQVGESPTTSKAQKEFWTRLRTRQLLDERACAWHTWMLRVKVRE